MLALRSATPREEKIIDRVNSLPLPELYRELGQNMGTLAPGVDPETGAKSWLAARRQEIHTLICVDGNYCTFIAHNRNARIIDIIGSVSDVVATIAGGLPVYTLTTLLVRQGLDELCQCGDS
jgi:hypothetical protein